MGGKLPIDRARDRKDRAGAPSERAKEKFTEKRAKLDRKAREYDDARTPDGESPPERGED